MGTYGDGSTYSGQWRAGVPHGAGQRRGAAGDEAVGQFRDGLFAGRANSPGY